MESTFTQRLLSVKEMLRRVEARISPILASGGIGWGFGIRAEVVRKYIINGRNER